MIQKVNLPKKHVLTTSDIERILNSARSSYDYAKFIFPSNIYITVAYFRDGSIEIFTNSRDIGLWGAIQNLRSTHTQTRIVDFIFRWIQYLNK